MKSLHFCRIIGLVAAMGFNSFGEALASSTASDSAVVYYQQGDYRQALDVWNEQAASGMSSAELYYNIGVTESLLHQTPEAVYAFEQALRLKPANKKIKVALVEERKKIENAVIPVNPFFLQKWYEAFLSFLRPGYWAMLGLGLLCLLTLNFLAGFQVLLPKPFLAGNLKWGIGGVALLALFLAGMAYKEIYREDEAIVFSSCVFRPAPSEDSPEIRILFPGEKTFIKDRIGDWVNIKLLNQDAGWIPKDCLKMIRINRK